MTNILQAYGEGAMSQYLNLIERFPLRPLGTEADLEQALAVMDELIDRPGLSRAEEDYLRVLTGLIAQYEQKAYPPERVSDAEMLRFLIEQKGVTQNAVAAATGIAESTVSEVLTGKRKLNRGHIGKLGAYFHVGPGVFSFEE